MYMEIERYDRKSLEEAWKNIRKHTISDEAGEEILLLDEEGKPRVITVHDLQEMLCCRSFFDKHYIYPKCSTLEAEEFYLAISNRLEQEGCRLPFAVGRQEDGGVSIIDLGKYAEIMIESENDAGNMIDSLMISVLFGFHGRCDKLLVMDLDEQAFAKYAKIPHIEDCFYGTIITKSKDAIEAFRFLTQEVKRRKDICSFKTKSFCIDDYNALPNVEKLPHILVIVNGIEQLLMYDAENTNALIVEMRHITQKMGIHFLFISKERLWEGNEILRENIQKLICWHSSERIEMYDIAARSLVEEKSLSGFQFSPEKIEEVISEVIAHNRKTADLLKASMRPASVFLAGSVYYNERTKRNYREMEKMLKNLDWEVLNPGKMIKYLPQSATHFQRIKLFQSLMETCDACFFPKGYQNSPVGELLYLYAVQRRMHVIREEDMPGKQGKSKDLNVD